MTTIILLFVAVQLGAGFLILIAAMQSAREGYEDEAGFHYSARPVAPVRCLKHQPCFRTPVLVLVPKVSTC